LAGLFGVVLGACARLCGCCPLAAVLPVVVKGKRIPSGGTLVIGREQVGVGVVLVLCCAGACAALCGRCPSAAVFVACDVSAVLLCPLKEPQKDFLVLD
jgi:hypothetical protein